MPIYEYNCKNCDHHFEEIQKISDPVLVKCNKCGKDSLQKLVSAAGFRLSGGGWYETDFKGNKETKRNLSETSGSSSTSGSTTSKTTESSN